MPETPDLMDKIQFTARIGIWCSTAALCLLVAASGYVIWMALSDTPAFVREVQLELDLTGEGPDLSTGQALIVALAWLATYAVGGLMIWTIRAMFTGIRRDGVFTLDTARRIRRIGWLFFSLFPASTLVVTAEVAMMTYWNDRSELVMMVGLEEADIYSILLGLVLVALGHIMTNAVQISNENKAFV